MIGVFVCGSVCGSVGGFVCGFVERKVINYF